MSGRQRAVPFYGHGEVSRVPRILLISYHFPPGQATGALRWQKFAAHLGAHGWGLDVVTLDPSDLDQADMRRLADLPAGTRLFGAREGTPRVERLIGVASAARRRGRSVRAAAVPATNGGEADTQLIYAGQLGAVTFTPATAMRAFNAWRAVRKDDPWAATAAAVAERVAEEGLHRAIVTCGPPHAAHMAGARVSRRTGIPLILDLRDPWGLAQAVDRSRASPLFFALRARQEAHCVNAAALILTNSETHQMALRAVHRSAADRIQCVLNGYDPEEIPAGARTSRFSVAYAGNIYLDRDPRGVFAAAGLVVRRLGLTPDQFGIDLIGSVDTFGGQSTAELARRAGVGEFVQLHGRRPRAEALDFLTRATMLLSLPQDLDLSVPSKIYEYFQFEAWLLALARPLSGTEILLRGTGADVVAPNDVAAIADVIERRYTQFANGDVPPRLMHLNPHLSRSHQATRLIAALDRAASISAGAA